MPHLIRTLRPWLVLVGIALLVVTLTQRFTEELWRVPATAGVSTLREAAAARDVQSFDVPHYIDYGRQLAEKGNLLSWHSAFWPPGMAIVGALKTRLFGESAYALELILFAAVLWATALYFWLRVVPWRGKAWAPFAFLSLPWCLPTFREWAIGVGSLGSESGAGALFVVALALAVGGIVRRDTRLQYGALFAMAGAAYFRAEYDVYATFALCALMLVNVASSVRARKTTPGLRRSAALFSIFLALTLPWKLFLQKQYGHFNMSLALYYSAEKVFWTPTSPDFAFGGNTPCLIDPETCRTVMASGDRLTMGEKLALAERTFLRHPLKWVAYKAQFLDRFWFGYPASELFGARFLYLLDGLFHLACLALAAFILFRARPRGESRENVSIFLVASLGFLAAYAGIFLLAPLEVRYTFPLRLFLMALPLAALALTRTAGSELRLLDENPS